MKIDEKNDYKCHRGCLNGEGMTALEAWGKYKHLDANLSDIELLPESFWGSIIFDLWKAVKESVKEEIT